MKIAIVGSREFPPSKFSLIQSVILSLPRDSEIVSGGARGVDSVAERFAIAAGHPTKIFKPDPKMIARFDFRTAAYARNAEIAQYADRCFAFRHKNSPGTSNTMKLFRDLNKPVDEFSSDPLKISTSFASYRGASAFDVARLSADEGSSFAPSWKLLSPFLAKRKGSGLTAEDWQEYREAYIAEMRISWQENPSAWVNLLSRREVVLTCYCRNPEQCHRTILGAEILPKLGAVFLGEKQGGLPLF